MHAQALNNVVKRLIALVVPFLVLVGAVITLAWLEARRAPDWETEFNNYVARRGLARESIKIQAVVEAGRPWDFSATMGKPVSNDWPWGIDELPFPPAAVRCVLLEKEGESAFDVEGEPQRQVIYVGYHNDTLWRAGWLVHEGPQTPFTPELATDLATVGCDLSLEGQIN